MRYRLPQHGRTPVPAADARLLKADDYAALIEAADLIATAERAAAQIVADAEQQAEQQRRSGYRDGRRAARAELAAQRVAESAAAETRLRDLERDIADAVVTAVRRIVGEFDDAERAARLALEAVAAFRDARRISVRVAPQAVAGLETRLRQRYPELTLVEVVAAPGLDADRCVIDSDHGGVDASLEVQLAALAEALRGVDV